MEIQKFFDACKTGNLDIVHSYISSKNTQQVNQRHGCILACQNGQLSVIKLLYSSKHELMTMSNAFETIDWDRMEYLKAACQYDQLQVVEYLLANGTKIHAINQTIFEWACEWGSLNITKYTVGHGADIAYSNYNGFYLACYYGHLNIVKYLVSVEKNIVHANDSYFYPACYNGHLDIVKYVVSLGVNIHSHSESAFRWSCRYGQLEVVKYLVSLGVDVHINNDQAFEWACEAGYLNVVKYLLSLNANVKVIVNSAKYVGRSVSLTVYLSQFLSEEEYETIVESTQHTYISFHDLLIKFYHEKDWIVEDHDIKQDQLWDSNIGMIVSMFCW